MAGLDPPGRAPRRPVWTICVLIDPTGRRWVASRGPRIVPGSRAEVDPDTTYWPYPLEGDIAALCPPDRTLHVEWVRLPEGVDPERVDVDYDCPGFGRRWRDANGETDWDHHGFACEDEGLPCCVAVNMGTVYVIRNRERMHPLWSPLFDDRYMEEIPG